MGKQRRIHFGQLFFKLLFMIVQLFQNDIQTDLGSLKLVQLNADPFVFFFRQDDIAGRGQFGNFFIAFLDLFVEFDTFFLQHDFPLVQILCPLPDIFLNAYMSEFIDHFHCIRFGGGIQQNGKIMRLLPIPEDHDLPRGLPLLTGFFCIPFIFIELGIYMLGKIVPDSLPFQNAQHMFIIIMGDLPFLLGQITKIQSRKITSGRMGDRHHHNSQDCSKNQQKNKGQKDQMPAQDRLDLFPQFIQLLQLFKFFFRFVTHKASHFL